MDGQQLTVYERLGEIRQKVADGAYGADDDFDVDSFEDDLEDITHDM